MTGTEDCHESEKKSSSDGGNDASKPTVPVKPEDRAVASAESIAEEALRCRCMVMGVIGDPFSDRSSVALSMVRVLRKALKDPKVLTLDFSTDSLAVPKAEYSITVMLNLELCVDPRARIDAALKHGYVVYASSIYPGIGHFSMTGDVHPFEALEHLRRNKALYISSGYSEEDVMAAVPLNKTALGKLSKFIRDRSFYRDGSVDVILKWRSYVEHFDLDEEFRYLLEFIRPNIPGQDFADICIMFHNSHMSSGYPLSTGMLAVNTDILDRMVRHRIVHKRSETYIIPPYTSEVLRQFCMTHIFGGNEAEWNLAAFNLLRSLSNPGHRVSAPVLLGVAVPATRHASRSWSGGSTSVEWKVYSCIIRYLRANGAFNDRSEGCRHVLERMVDALDPVCRTITGWPDGCVGWYTNEGPLSPTDVRDWLTCKLVDAELDGPFHANLVKLKARLDGVSAGLPFANACRARFEYRVLERVNNPDPSSLGVVSDPSSAPNVDLSTAGPVEVVDAFIVYVDTAIERNFWTKDTFWKAWICQVEWLNRLECDPGIKAGCRIRMGNLYSRMSRKYKSFHGVSLADRNLSINVEDASDVIAEARLLETMDRDELVRLEQETLIERAKVMISEHNVFSAEILVRDVLNEPHDEVTLAAALDCHGMMRLSLGDSEAAMDDFRKAIGLYEAHLMRRKAIACRARLMLSLAQAEDYSESKDMEEELENFVSGYQGEYVYTAHLVSGFIRRTYRPCRASCCPGSS